MPRDVIPSALKIEDEIAAEGIEASMYKLEALVAAMHGIEESRRYTHEEAHALIGPIYAQLRDLEYAIMRSKPQTVGGALCLLMLAQNELAVISGSNFDGEVLGAEEAERAVREALRFLMAREDRSLQELPAQSYYMAFRLYGTVKPAQEAA
ncbi:hypothetical protein AB4Z01_14935 [Inquilinus sp. YAF38]|uniref:hypothetical protein n=1 Tax=Inquilinus sp. YAF38 TaxID=3233084 RepID=UPI003F8FA083